MSKVILISEETTACSMFSVYLLLKYCMPNTYFGLIYIVLTISSGPSTPNWTLFTNLKGALECAWIAGPGIATEESI